MTKLFIGGLPFSYTSQDLQNLVSEFGAVLSTVVIMDRDTNRSKGFGFVEMSSDEDAQKAISKLNGTMVEDRKLNVSVARPKEDRPRDNSRGGYDRDNFRGGRR